MKKYACSIDKVEHSHLSKILLRLLQYGLAAKKTVALLPQLAHRLLLVVLLLLTLLLLQCAQSASHSNCSQQP
jgi:hypothetical protein